ncbi:hypothetical protein [Candidatus Hydrogenosomobacter endosymbioticus]|uniref:Uncharacterized protein n=1 Tax=Candidatus Hydrogenosomobacter endosymbioticus TaxID=2558174 RepID=A0ABN6L2T8_9PROT|nr:hypothetical protein [Candidatus Hydrogenosomobacter endosymbioticus]BDB96161.1 hypothetical protein HYD_2940 [Candidatus Hydrogenosomobacter endosymbioticus]
MNSIRKSVALALFGALFSFAGVGAAGPNSESLRKAAGQLFADRSAQSKGSDKKSVVLSCFSDAFFSALSKIDDGDIDSFQIDETRHILPIALADYKDPNGGVSVFLQENGGIAQFIRDIFQRAVEIEKVSGRSKSFMTLSKVNDDTQSRHKSSRLQFLQSEPLGANAGNGRLVQWSQDQQIGDLNPMSQKGGYLKGHPSADFGDKQRLGAEIVDDGSDRGLQAGFSQQRKLGADGGERFGRQNVQFENMLEQQNVQLDNALSHQQESLKEVESLKQQKSHLESMLAQQKSHLESMLAQQKSQLDNALSLQQESLKEIGCLKQQKSHLEKIAEEQKNGMAQQFAAQNSAVLPSDIIRRLEIVEKKDDLARQYEGLSVQYKSMYDEKCKQMGDMEAFFKGSLNSFKEEISSQVKNVSDKFDGDYSKRVRELEGRYKAFEERMASFNGEIRGVVDGIDSRVSEFGSSLQNVKQECNEYIVLSVKGLEDLIRQKDLEMTEFEKRMEAASLERDRTASDRARMDLDNTDKKIQRLSGTMDSVNGTSAELSRAQRQLFEDVAALDRKIIEQSNTFNQRYGELSERASILEQSNNESAIRIGSLEQENLRLADMVRGRAETETNQLMSQANRMLKVKAPSDKVQGTQGQQFKRPYGSDRDQDPYLGAQNKK